MNDRVKIVITIESLIKAMWPHTKGNPDFSLLFKINL